MNVCLLLTASTLGISAPESGLANKLECCLCGRRLPTVRALLLLLMVLLLLCLVGGDGRHNVQSYLFVITSVSPAAAAIII
jgi:hypothetical protein